MHFSTDAKYNRHSVTHFPQYEAPGGPPDLCCPNLQVF